MLPVQQQGVFAAPAESRFGGERHFQHRGAVGEDAKMMRTDFAANLFCKYLQVITQYFVIIPAQRVAGNVGRFGVGQHGMRIGRGRGKIVQPRADDTDRSRHQFGRAAALDAVRRHIIHLAMKPLSQPRLQSRFGRTQVNVGNPDCGKAELAPPLPDALRQFR